MNYWLMSLSWGKKTDYLELMKKMEIISLGCFANDEQPEPDLKIFQTKNDLYNEIDIPNKGGKSSLWLFANDMNIGDIVYIRGFKRKSSIRAMCIIKSNYYYNESKLKHEKDLWKETYAWPHFRDVEWLDFIEVDNKEIHTRQTLYKINDKYNKYIVSLEKMPITEARIQLDKIDDNNMGEMEGAQHFGMYTKYERSSKNRQAAIDSQGLTCRVCGFNFGKAYGEFGEGFIEVHHIDPLANSGEKVIDPQKDLIVLCSNCHRILHRKQENNMTWETLKNIVENKKQ